MKVQEPKGVCKDTIASSQVEGSDLCLPQWETGVILCMYVYIFRLQLNCSRRAVNCLICSSIAVVSTAFQLQLQFAVRV
jgi:hypothetical protein